VSPGSRQWLARLPAPAQAAWLGGDLLAFEAELRMVELFRPGTVAGLLELMQGDAAPDPETLRITERIAAT
jgi:hypothetical protein